MQFILVVSFILGLLVTALLSYFYVKQAFAPIDVLNTQITRISQNRLDERVSVSQSQEELNQLAKNFNQMLDRIENAFKVQRSFIQHASHELRTPLANLITSCDAALNRTLNQEEYKHLIESLNEEHHKLVEVTNALLLLSQYEDEELSKTAEAVRIDEIIFESVEEVQALYPDHIIRFNMNEALTQEKLTLNGRFVLLKTAISNLIRNSCKYTDNKEIIITVNSTNNLLEIAISNTGPTIEDHEIPFLMMPFYRANNAQTIKGFGLGLSIANRIIILHHGSILYSKENDINLFTINFSS